MNRAKEFLKKWLKHYIPQPLPNGVTEFDRWSDEIISNYGFPVNDSMKFTLATMIMHMDHADSHVPYRTFAKRIQKAMANQVAGQIFQDIKLKQAEEAERAKLDQVKALDEKDSSIAAV